MHAVAQREADHRAGFSGSAAEAVIPSVESVGSGESVDGGSIGGVVDLDGEILAARTATNEGFGNTDLEVAAIESRCGSECIQV